MLIVPSIQMEICLNVLPYGHIVPIHGHSVDGHPQPQGNFRIMMFIFVIINFDRNFVHLYYISGKVFMNIFRLFVYVQY